MGLGSIVRNARAIAKGVVGGSDGLTLSVTVEPFDELDGYAQPSYGSSTSYDAVVDSTTRLMRMPNGQEVLAKHRITFLESVAIGSKDRITLPDGSTGPILDVSGVMDASTDRPFVTDVILGHATTAGPA